MVPEPVGTTGPPGGVELPLPRTRPGSYPEAMAGVAAQAVVVVHLTYLLYVLLGGLLGLKDVHWLWPHAVTAVWGVVGVATQMTCPLTALQKHLMVLDGTPPYAGTFIEQHVAGVVYPASWQTAVWYVTALVVLVSYTLTFVRHTNLDAPVTH